MSLPKVIQTFFAVKKLAPYLSVPGWGLTGSSPGFVTLYQVMSLPAFPHIFPANPTEQPASCCLFAAQFRFLLQHWSMAFIPRGLPRGLAAKVLDSVTMMRRRRKQNLAKAEVMTAVRWDDLGAEEERVSAHL